MEWILASNFGREGRGRGVLGLGKERRMRAMYGNQ